MKMSDKTKRYIHSYCLDENDKRLLMECFKRKVRTKKKDMVDYLEVTNYERMVSVYDESCRKFVEEVRMLPLGTIDYWDMLSGSCQNYINHYFFEKNNKDYQHELSMRTVSPGEFKFIENKLDRIKEYCQQHNLDYVDEDGKLDPEYIEKVFYQNRLIDKDKVTLDVIVYAIKEKEYDWIDLDADGNVVLTALAIDLFINKLYLVPMSTEEKLRSSVSRSYITFKDYALCNASRFSYFVTLTFADINSQDKHIKLNNERKQGEIDLKFDYVNDATDYDECVKTMTKFLHYMKIYLKRKGLDFYYLGVPEYQKNGNIHYHFLMSDIPSDMVYDCPLWLDRDYNTNKIVHTRSLKLWKYGKSDVELIQNKSRISTYISKYMVKSLQEISTSEYWDRLNKKRYYNSNNLDKPVVTAELVDEESIEYVSKYSFIRHSRFDDSYVERNLYQLNKI